MGDTVKFSLGRTVATPGVLRALENAGDVAFDYLSRHHSGDWGIVPDVDAKANDEALQTGERLFSAYELSDGRKIWIITERDRSVTTVLLPEEY